MKQREWHGKAIELKNQGFSNYDIARQLWGKGSKESTLRYFFNHMNNTAIEPTPINTAKVLYWDIENAPFLSFHFDKWGVNIGNDYHVTEKFMLSHSWAWGDGEVFGCALTPEEARSQDDASLVLQAWTLLNEADIVIAHNGKKFDVPMINGFFLRHGFPPPSPYKVIDTYRIVKRKFKLTSNSLAYVAKFLGVTQKLDSGGIAAWKAAYFGDPVALLNMLTYNKGDIDTLREVYKIIRGWDNDGVNMGVYSEHSAVCSNCGSDEISVLEDRYQFTAVSKFGLVRCSSCKAISRFRKSTPIDVGLTRVV